MQNTTTFSWLLNSQSLEREFWSSACAKRLKERRMWKCGKKEQKKEARAAAAMQSHNMTDDISNSLCSLRQSSLEITKPIACDCLSSLLSERETHAGGRTLLAWPICSNLLHIPGANATSDLEMHSMRRRWNWICWLMKPLRRLHSEAVNMAGLSIDTFYLCGAALRLFLGNARLHSYMLNKRNV